MRILIVDDDTSLLDLMSAMLASKGLTNVKKSSSYREVLAAIDMDMGKSEPFDLIFCDCYVPGMDMMGFINGLEKRKFRGAVVLMTGAGLEVLESRELLASRKNLNILGAIQKSSLEQGMNDMLHKLGHSAAKPAA